MVKFAGVRNEFFTFVGELDSAAGTIEDEDVQFIFKILDGGGQRRLRNVKLFGGLIERACFCNADGIT